MNKIWNTDHIMTIGLVSIGPGPRQSTNAEVSKFMMGNLFDLFMAILEGSMTIQRI